MSNPVSVIVCALAAILSAGPASLEAGVVSYVKLNRDTADADSGISPDNVYTQLLDFGTGPAATINGVAFTQVTLANLGATAGFNYSINSGGLGQTANDLHNVTGAMVDLLTDFIYDGNNAPGGVATITLSGLVPGSEYQTRLYNRRWEPGQSLRRSARFEFDTDGVEGAEDRIDFIDQNDASLVPPSPEPPEQPWSPETANIMSYRFTADGSALTISITQNNPNCSWHVYGVTNQEFGVQDPLTWDGQGNGNWNSPTQWTGGLAEATPDLHTDTTVINNTVTVTEPGAARSLAVASGGIAIDGGQTLTVGYQADFAPGTTLSMGAGGSFSAGSGSIPSINSAGNATIGVTSGRLTVADVVESAAGTFTKRGDGTLQLNNLSTVTFDPATIVKVEGGTLESKGLHPLGPVTQVELAGGKLSLEGAGGAPIPGPAGAVAHYTFDTVAAGVTPNDGSAAMALDGVLTGDATQTTGNGGLIGEAMQFSGDGYVDVEHDASLGLNEFSVSAWVNLAVEPGIFGILGTRIDGDTTFDYKVMRDYVHGDVGDGTGWISTSVDIRTADVGGTGQGGDISVGDWHMVTYVVDETAKQFKLFLDGDLKRTMDYAGTPLLMKPGQSMWIGDDWDGHEPMIGLIDEVYVYGRALTTQEVSDLWGDGFGPNDGNAGLDMSTTDVLVTDDSTLHAAHGAVGGGPAEFADLTMAAGALTTTGTVQGITFAGTTIDAAATAVGFDPRVPTDYRTITNNSTQPAVTISKTGPGTWRLDGPLAGTTGNVFWRVEGGTLRVRGENTLSGRPITVADGTLDLLGETSLAGVAIELAGGTLRAEGIPGNPAPAPGGAIAHYAFDSAAAGITSNDGSAGPVLDGVLLGDAAVTGGGAGRIGEAMQFSGNGYVEVLYDAASLGNLNTFSVSAWVNIDTEPDGNVMGILGTRINTDGTGEGGNTFDVKVWNDMIHGDVGMGTGWISTAVDIRALDTGSTWQGGDVVAGQWHLVTYVIDDAAKQFQLYLDGDLKRTIDYSAGQTPLFMGPDQKLWIGDDWVGREEMIGRIDEVYVYGRALDTGEVDTLWGNGFGPNDGTAGLDMSNTDLLVTADSAVYAAQAAVGGAPTPFGRLTLNAGVLTTDGSAAGLLFAGTTIPADATAVGFDPRMPTDVGVIDANHAEVTISKAGPRDLVLDKVNLNLDNATFDVQEGRLIGLKTQWPLPTADPFGNAAVQLGGGELVLASGPDPVGVGFRNRVTVTADSTLTAGTGGVGEPGMAIAIGGAGTGVTLADATTLTLRSTDGCTLAVAGPISGPAAEVHAGEGDVVISGGASLQSLVVSDGMLHTASADVTVDDLSVRGAGQISTDAVGVTVNDGGAMHLGSTDYLAAGSSFNVSGLIDEHVAENLTLAGGMVTVSVPPTHTTGLSYVLITGDADCGIDASKTYTHALDLGNSGVATVNGVEFAGDFGVNGNPGSENLPIRHAGNPNTAVTGDVAEVFRDMDYNANPAEIILSGLTQGQLYDFRLYNRSWTGTFNRSQRFDYDVGNDGSIEESVVLNPDDPTDNPPGFVGADWNIGYAMSFVYAAGATGELKLNIAQLGGGTYHLYGLTNEEVVIPPAQTTLNNLAGSGTLSGDVIILGTISPGSSTGMVTFQDGDVELGENAVYQCEIAEWDSPGGLPPVPPLPDPPMDPTINDRIHSANRDIYLDGELTLTATVKLHPRVPHPDPPNVEVEWYGDQTRVIASSVGEAVVRYMFATVPDPQPESWDDILTGTPEWSQGHIGRGVFLTRQNEGGEDDAPGISYTPNATKLHLFQACDGDTNGDRTLGGRDIQNIQSFALFGVAEDPGPGFTWPPDWSQGDFDGDGLVTGLDILAILATGLWPTNDYAAIDPGEPLDGVVDLLLYPEDVTLEDGSVVPAGTLMIDPDGLTLNGYVLRSDSGIFTGAPAQQLNWFFVEDTDAQISGNMGAELSAVHDLGAVVGPEWTIINPFEKQDVNPFADLTLTYTVAGTPGTFVGNLIIIPEPSTLVMLFGTGGLGLLWLAARRRRTP